MTEQEKINSEIQMKFALQDAKFDVFMQELKEHREDMRRLQDRQDEERRRHDADMKALDKKILRLAGLLCRL